MTDINNFSWPDILLDAPWVNDAICMRSTELQLQIGEDLIPFGQVISVQDSMDRCAVIEVASDSRYALHSLRQPHQRNTEMLSMLHDHYVARWNESMEGIYQSWQ